jgi:glycosyltransferase involved in cell wall biosynthesis
VLSLVHGHPADRPFGAEVYAWELYQAMRADGRFAPTVVTRCDAIPGRPVLEADPADPHHYRLATDAADYDFLYHELRSPAVVGWWLGRLARELDPDVIHVQHTLYTGLGVFGRLRQAAPRARVVYTLHDFMPLCHHRGLLYRTHDPGPCDGPFPADCHRCFPQVSAASFSARHHHVRGRLAGVDVFVAPSRFLRDRYLAWGLSPDRVAVEEYGRQASPPVPHRPAERRDRFGFYGQISPFKGVNVLIKAVLILAADDLLFQVRLNGAGLEHQLPGWQTDYRRLLATAVATGRVTDHGPYRREHLAERLTPVDWVVVPSVWWENTPLVIQEALAAGR